MSWSPPSPLPAVAGSGSGLLATGLLEGAPTAANGDPPSAEGAAGAEVGVGVGTAAWSDEPSKEGACPGSKGEGSSSFAELSFLGGSSVRCESPTPPPLAKGELEDSTGVRAAGRKGESTGAVSLGASPSGVSASGAGTGGAGGSASDGSAGLLKAVMGEGEGSGELMLLGASMEVGSGAENWDSGKAGGCPAGLVLESEGAGTCAGGANAGAGAPAWKGFTCGGAPAEKAGGCSVMGLILAGSRSPPVGSMGAKIEDTSSRFFSAPPAPPRAENGEADSFSVAGSKSGVRGGGVGCVENSLGCSEMDGGGDLLAEKGEGADKGRGGENATISAGEVGVRAVSGSTTASASCISTSGGAGVKGPGSELSVPSLAGGASG